MPSQPAVMVWPGFQFTDSEENKKHRKQSLRCFGGGGWIRTTEANATDLQSAPFGHSGTPPYSIWSWWTDSNPRPADYKSAALPAELHQQISAAVQQQGLVYQRGAELSIGNLKKLKNFFCPRRGTNLEEERDHGTRTRQAPAAPAGRPAGAAPVDLPPVRGRAIPMGPGGAAAGENPVRPVPGPAGGRGGRK